MVLGAIYEPILGLTSAVISSDTASKTSNGSDGLSSLRPFNESGDQQPVSNNTKSSVVIFNHVNNSLDGRVMSADFSMIIANFHVTKGPTHRIFQTYDLINGSEKGTILQMMPGSFLVSPNNRMSKPITQAYNITFSGDCHPERTVSGSILGIGNIQPGQISKCNISRTLFAQQ